MSPSLQILYSSPSDTKNTWPLITLLCCAVALFIVERLKEITKGNWYMHVNLTFTCFYYFWNSM